MRPARRRPASAAASRTAAAKQASSRRSAYPVYLYIIALIFTIIIGYEIFILIRNSSNLQLPETPAERIKNSSEPERRWYLDEKKPERRWYANEKSPVEVEEETSKSDQIQPAKEETIIEEKANARKDAIVQNDSEGTAEKNSEDIEENANIEADEPVPNVKHAFAWSSDRAFVGIDRYETYVDGKQSSIVLGDGTIPHKLDIANNKVIPLVTCVQGAQRAEATISMIEGHMDIGTHYDETKNGNHFSSNGDRFKTLLLDCPIPVDPLAPLRLEGTENPEWSIEISHPVVSTASEELSSEQLSLAYCLCPVYGLKEGKWLIEWLEYHLALGISLIHVYLFATTPMMDSVFDIYKREKKIVVHDWSMESSSGYIRKSYEKAKWAAQTDCLLRERGRQDFIVMTDIDELLRFPYFGIKPNTNPMHRALDWCYEKFKEDKLKRGCSFNSHTITSIYTKLTKEEFMFEEQSNGILLDRYSFEESKPHCPYNCRCYDLKDPNCRMFHYGRQKFMIYIRDLSLPPVVLWTHAIKRNYGGEAVMSIFPDDIIHVRHYQGHWYLKKDRLAGIEEIDSKLNPEVLKKVKQRLDSHDQLGELYFQSSRERGIPWVETQERDEKFHRWLLKKEEP